MKIKLHYINSGKLYGAEVFKKEAKEIGINRALPINQIKHLKWSDKIYIATYEPKPLQAISNPDDIPRKMVMPDGRGNKRDGIAHVFGYFHVTGLNYNASDEFKKLLTAQLNVEKSSEPNQAVQRQCGSYIISASYVVTDTLEDIINKAQKLAEERKETIKFFIAGTFIEIPQTVTVSPINFARGLINIEINDNPEPQDITEEILKIVSTLTDYTKRAYIKTGKKCGRPRKETK